MNGLLVLSLALVALSVAAPVKDDPKHPKPLSDAAKKFQKEISDLGKAHDKAYSDLMNSYPVEQVNQVRAEQKAEQKAIDENKKRKVTVAPLILSAAAQKLKKLVTDQKAAQAKKLEALLNKEEKKIKKEVYQYNKALEASEKKVLEQKPKQPSDAAKKLHKALYEMKQSFKAEETELANKQPIGVINEVKAYEQTEEKAKADKKSKVTPKPLSAAAKGLLKSLTELRAVQDFKRDEFIKKADSKVVKELNQYEKAQAAYKKKLAEENKLVKPLSDAGKKHKSALDALVKSFKAERTALENKNQKGAVAEVIADEKAEKKAKDAKKMPKVTAAPVPMSNASQRLKKALAELKEAQKKKVEAFEKENSKALKELRQFEKDTKAYKQKQEEAAKNKKG